MRILTVAICAAVLATGMDAGPYQAFAFSDDQPRWTTTNLQYQIESSFVNSFTLGVARLNDAAANWNAAGTSGVFSVSSTSASSNRIKAGSLACDTLGVTAPFVNSLKTEYTSFNITINTYCGFAFYDGSQSTQIPSNYFDLTTLLRHELGHAIGLCHVTGGNELMNSAQPIGAAGIKFVSTDAVNGRDYMYKTNYSGPAPNSHCYESGLIPAGGTFDYRAQVYSGNWYHLTGISQAYGGTLGYSNGTDPNARVSFTFYGSRITHIYGADSASGNRTVYIDGNLVASYNAYGGFGRLQVRRSWDVALGNHVIEIRNTGGYGKQIGVDAFEVNAQSVGAYCADNVDPSVFGVQLGYTGGGWTHQNSAPGAINNTQSYANTFGNSAKFTFTGNQVVYKYSKRPSGGYAAITIDGIAATDIDMYSSQIIRQQSTTFSNLGPGVHELVISVALQKNPASSDYVVDVDQICSN